NFRLLRAACASGNVHIVQYIHAAFGVTKEHIEGNGCHAFWIACYHGHVNLVRWMFSTFQPVDWQDNYLAGACAQGQLEVVKYLCLVFNLTAEHIKSNHASINAVCSLSFYIDSNCGDRVGIVRFWHTEYKFTLSDFPVARVCRNGLVDVFTYFHKHMGLTRARLAAE